MYGKHPSFCLCLPCANRRFLTPMPTTKELLERKNMASYIVWNPTSNLPPRVVHADRPAAIKVAGRMANNEPGESFYVCKLVHKASKPRPIPVPSVVYEDLEKDPPASMPF